MAPRKGNFVTYDMTVFLINEVIFASVSSTLQHELWRGSTTNALDADGDVGVIRCR